MKKFALVLIPILFAAAASAPSFAEVREIRSMRELPAYVGPRTLLVFDLDNTIIQPVQTLGSDQWFDHLVARFTAAGETAPVDHAIAQWSEVQKRTRMRAVEAGTPRLIAQAQAAGIPVIALTARPAELSAVTEAQLASVGVQFFTKNLLPALNREVDLGDGARLIHGITFVGPKLSKGEVLSRILRGSGIEPARVVFADDKLKHVNAVEAALAQFPGLEHFELRYGAADSQVAAYDERIATIEEKEFARSGRILSDRAAAAGL